MRGHTGHASHIKSVDFTHSFNSYFVSKSPLNGDSCSSVTSTPRQSMGSMSIFNQDVVSPHGFPRFERSSSATSLMSPTHNDAINSSAVRCLLESNEQVVFVDCRYPYEYKAGHMLNSLNLWNTNLMINQIIDMIRNGVISCSTYILFYCEYCERRAPRRMNALKRYLRCNGINMPNIYIINGGFRELYSTMEGYFTGYYLPMDDLDYASEKKEYDRLTEGDGQESRLCCSCSYSLE